LTETVSLQEITIRRVFDAPRELVWKAWTEPARLARWWGKRGWSTPPATITMDVRPGGVFRLTSVNDEDGREMAFEAVYGEVDEPERLTFGAATVTLTDLGDGRTEMHFEQRGHLSPEWNERTKAGWGGFFDRIAERLT
jgi:uncharacterized protein YndB with AHSA1/START domain